ncbi:RING-type E3 ubiquitin transferase [Sarracenia purpurea var. burkii]
MSDEVERTCPLCAEEMDLTDQQLKPCKCGYEMKMCVLSSIYLFAFTLVPALLLTTGGEACILTAVSFYKQLLQHREYFGQYGKVLKVSISRTAAGSIQHLANNTCSVYITYSKEEEAVRCIQSVHGFVLDGRSLRACFGTTKYCHAWLRSVPCSNPDCLYLHEIGSQEDSFSKDEIISAYTSEMVTIEIGCNNGAFVGKLSALASVNGQTECDCPYMDNSTFGTLSHMTKNIILQPAFLLYSSPSPTPMDPPSSNTKRCPFSVLFASRWSWLPFPSGRTSDISGVRIRSPARSFVTNPNLRKRSPSSLCRQLATTNHTSLGPTRGFTANMLLIIEAGPDSMVNGSMFASLVCWNRNSTMLDRGKLTSLLKSRKNDVSRLTRSSRSSRQRANSSFRKDLIPSDSEAAVGAIVSPWSAYFESSSSSSGISFIWL